MKKEETDKKISIECDHDLTREQKTTIEKITQLRNMKVNLKATTETVIKDEGKISTNET